MACQLRRVVRMDPVTGVRPNHTESKSGTAEHGRARLGTAQSSRALIGPAVQGRAMFGRVEISRVLLCRVESCCAALRQVALGCAKHCRVEQCRSGGLFHGSSPEPQGSLATSRRAVSSPVWLRRVMPLSRWVQPRHVALRHALLGLAWTRLAGLGQAMLTSSSQFHSRHRIRGNHL